MNEAQTRFTNHNEMIQLKKKKEALLQYQSTIPALDTTTESESDSINSRCTSRSFYRRSSDAEEQGFLCSPAAGVKEKSKLRETTARQHLHSTGSSPNRTTRQPAKVPHSTLLNLASFIDYSAKGRLNNGLSRRSPSFLI